MTRPTPPYPSTDLRTWALQLVEYLSARERISEQVLPRPVQLAYRQEDEKAVTDGTMMYDPVIGAPVYSKGGQWYKVADDTLA